MKCFKQLITILCETDFILLYVSERKRKKNRRKKNTKKKYKKKNIKKSGKKKYTSRKKIRIKKHGSETLIYYWYMFLINTDPKPLQCGSKTLIYYWYMFLIYHGNTENVRIRNTHLLLIHVLNTTEISGSEKLILYV